MYSITNSTTRMVQMCPTVEDTFLNRALVSPLDELLKYGYVELINDQWPNQVHQPLVYTLEPCDHIPERCIGLNFVMRKQSQISHNRTIIIRPYRFNHQFNDCIIGCLTLDVDFMHELDREMISHCTKLNVDELEVEFRDTFHRQAFFVGQEVVFRFQRNKTLRMKVKKMEDVFSYQTIHIGLLVPGSRILFEKSIESKLQLTKMVNTELNFHASNMFDEDDSKNNFITVIKQSMSDGHFPEFVIQSSGIRLVRGMLLYGPIGTGKLSFAMQIGKMLNSIETEIFHCSKETSCWEKLKNQLQRMRHNIRNHRIVLILDRIDELFEGNDYRWHEFYRNIDSLVDCEHLLVAITNRMDRIPREMIRNGRFELQLEITLPTIHGRIELLHTINGKMEYLKLVNNDNIDLSFWHYMIMCFTLLTANAWYGKKTQR